MGLEFILGQLTKDKTATLGTFVIAGIIYATVKLIELVLDRIRKKFDTKEKIKGILKREEADQYVHDIMSTALASFGGERMQVVEFSNGIKNIALVPWKYMSCTYEAVSLGAKTMAHEVQNVLTSLFGIFLMRLANNSYVVLNIDAPDPSLPSYIYSLMDKRGSLHSLYVPIRDPRSFKSIGYLSYDDNRVNCFTDKVITGMRALSAQIGTYITLHSD